MKTFTLTYSFDCSVEEHWKLYFDKDLNAALFKALGFPSYELLSFDETETTIRRAIRVTPKLDLPGPVDKLLGARFAYREDGTFDKKKGVYEWKNTPTSLADKLVNEGTVRAAPSNGGCVRTCEFRLEAHIFGVGGLVESALEKNVRSGWDRSADFMKRWLRGER